MNSIVIEGLRKTYGDIHALDGLDLIVEKGVVFGFLGPNGAGKTTTLRILAGVAIPAEGKAWIEGIPVGPRSKARSLVGYLPEEPAFYPWMKAREYLVDLIGGLYGLSRREAVARGDEMLALVGLEDSAQRKIGGFSRGMRQRLGLAQALMNRPRVLLLDEPVSALDPAGRRDILQLIKKLGEETTVFMSTHILNDVERVCDRVGILNHGRIIAKDTTENLLGRYAWPIYEIAFAAEPESVKHWMESLRELSFIQEMEFQEEAVRIVLDGSNSASFELQRQVLGSNLRILSYQQVHPQLEDVFMGLVGEK